MATAGDRYTERTGNIWSYAYRNDLSGLKAAIARGVPVTIRNTVGWSPVHAAAAGGSLKALRYLAKLEGVELDSVDSGGNTPAHQAAKNGHVTSLKLLQELGVDVTVVRLSHAKGKATRDWLMNAYQQGGGKSKSDLEHDNNNNNNEPVGYARKQAKSNAFFGPRRSHISTKIKKKIMKEKRLKQKEKKHVILNEEETKFDEPACLTVKNENDEAFEEPSYIETVQRIKRSKKQRQKKKMGRRQQRHPAKEEMPANDKIDVTSNSSGSENGLADEESRNTLCNGFAVLGLDNDSESDVE